MAANGIDIRYGDIGLIAHELRSIGEVVEALGEGNDFATTFPDIWFCASSGIEQKISSLSLVKGELTESAEYLSTLAGTLDKVVALCEDKEKAVKALLDQNVSPEGLDYNPPTHSGGHADEYYGGLDQAEKDAAARATMKEALLAFLATYYPEVYAAYMQKVHDAEEAEWLEVIKNDPELSWLYDLIMAEKKKQQDALKAAEETAAALGEGAGAGVGGFGGAGGGLDDVGGIGGGGGLGDLGSDFGGGGGGGLGDFGSDWSSDLLEDSIDADEALGAEGALSDIAKPGVDGASSTGADALADELGEANSGFWGKYGDQVASFAHAYGLQAAALAGGAVALYATREQTTEAVAHVAEFVTTKCKPAALDVMDQVGDIAKKTRVNLGNTKSRVIGVARGEEAGDLIG